jgi:hypothetical protein
MLNPNTVLRYQVLLSVSMRQPMSRGKLKKDTSKKESNISAR